MNDVILMVEDNPDDAQLLERQLQHSRLRHELHIVPDGREAIDYLSRAGRYSDMQPVRFPCLLLIDFQVPGVDGFALVEWVRKNRQTKDIPIIIYSGSASPEDATRAYALGANACFAKLTGPGHYNLLFSAIQEFYERADRKGPPP